MRHRDSNDLLFAGAWRLAEAGHAVRGEGSTLHVDGPNGVVVTIVAVEEADQRALQLIAPICDDQLVPPRHMLIAAANLSAGAIAVVAGRYVIRVVVPAAAIAHALIASVTYAATAARALATASHTRYPEPLDGGPFHHFAA